MAGSDAASPELQRFVAQMQDRAKANEVVAMLTEKCWDKCMSYPGKSLSSKEEQCMMNCARRFLDTAQFLKRAMEDQH